MPLLCSGIITISPAQKCPLSTGITGSHTLEYAETRRVQLISGNKAQHLTEKRYFYYQETLRFLFRNYNLTIMGESLPFLCSPEFILDRYEPNSIILIKLNNILSLKVSLWRYAADYPMKSVAQAVITILIYFAGHIVALPVVNAGF